jgi:hypothetical protein
VHDKSPQAAVQQPEALTPGELEPLWRLERHASWLQIAAMVTFLLAAAGARQGDDLAWLAAVLLAVALLLLAAATILQVRLRCPRCRGWLRSGILRALPDKCPKCGVAFPREPSGAG